MPGRKKGGPKGPPLPPEKIGRMIRALQKDVAVRTTWPHYYTTRKRRHTDKEIMLAFGFTKEEFQFFLDKYLFRRDWDYDKVRKAFFAFVDKNGRWPTKKDYRAWRLTGLPWPETIATWTVGGRDTVTGVSRLMFEYVTARPRRVTPEMVLAIPNVTTRRSAIGAYGYDRLMGAGKLVQEDSYGKLWRLPTDGADPFMLFVEVVNKTPRMDEDGAYVRDKNDEFVYDHYFLRVPPTMTSARHAVSWTFNRQLISFSAES